MGTFKGRAPEVSVAFVERDVGVRPVLVGVFAVVGNDNDVEYSALAGAYNFFFAFHFGSSE